MTIGTPGNYNLNHIFASMTARAAGVDYVNVPYTGGSKVVADLLGQHVDAGVLKPSETLGPDPGRPAEADRRLRQRAAGDVSGCADLQGKGLRRVSLRPGGADGLCRRAGQPARRCQGQADHAFRAAIQDPRFKEFAKKNAFLVDDLTGDALTKEVDDVAAALGTVADKGLPERISCAARQPRLPDPDTLRQRPRACSSRKSPVMSSPHPWQRPFTSSRGWLYKTRGTCLVEIETDDGIVGWGECYGPSAVAKAFIDTQLAPRVIGRDPFDVEVIWEDLYNRIKDYGPKGMSIAAISGIDIALWDIIGKACNKPIHKLIGGAFRTEVDCLRHRAVFHRHGPAGRRSRRGSRRLCRRRASRRSR